MSKQPYDRAEHDASFRAQFGVSLDELELRNLRIHPGDEMSVEDANAYIAFLEARIEATKRGDDPEVNAYEERVRHYLGTYWGKSSESE